jgi:DNA-binding NtrC family response regulator
MLAIPLSRAYRGGVNSSAIPILVVDDEPGVRLLACQTLQRAGYAILEAEDGAQAVDMLERQNGRVALVLSDIRMPKLDGIELEQICRERWPALPVLLMSGEVTRDWVARLVRQGAQPVLRKPFLGDTLLELVRSILNSPSGGASNLA